MMTVLKGAFNYEVTKRSLALTRLFMFLFLAENKMCSKNIFYLWDDIIKYTDRIDEKPLMFIELEMWIVKYENQAL